MGNITYNERDFSTDFGIRKKPELIGIPAFLLEDGSITLDPAKVGLVEYGSDIQACSIEDHKNGKQGC